MGIGGDLGVRHDNDIQRCNHISMQHPSIGSVPSVAVLSTPAACYSAGGGGDCFAHKVEHGMHSTDECTSTAMCQAASVDQYIVMTLSTQNRIIEAYH